MNVQDLKAILRQLPDHWDVMVHVGDYNDNVDISAVEGSFEAPNEGYVQINVGTPDE